MPLIGRRRVLAAALAGAAALTIAVVLPRVRRQVPGDPLAPDPNVADEVNAWLTISPDDRVTVRVAQVELGQGVLTALAMFAAEELECRWDDVRVEMADVNRSVAHDRLYHNFRTDGSYAVRGSRRPMQIAGANARTRLIAAAAARWKVDAAQCRAIEGRVVHERTGASLRFGELVAEAARIQLPSQKIALKEPSQFRLVGQPVGRLDVAAKVNGQAVYGIDIRVPDMRCAAVLHCPTLGGTVGAVRDRGANGAGGKVFALPDAIVAVALTHWQARRRLADVEVDWDLSSAATESTPALRGRFLDALKTPATAVLDRGDAPAALQRDPSAFEAVYDVPYLAHACMEPLNCTASISDGQVDVWVGTQDPEGVVALAAEVTGLPTSKVRVHQQWVGGGFGRRVAMDFVGQALAIAKRLRKPVQMIWTREQDTRAGMYRPMAAFLLRAAVAPGQPTAFFARVATDSILQHQRPQDPSVAVDPSSKMGLADTAYGWDHVRVECGNVATRIPTWYWRSVGDSQNAFAVECFMDELAEHVGTDALALRRVLLRNQPRHLAVLDVIARQTDLQATLPPGRGRGLALHQSSATVVGMVVDVRVSPEGAVAVEHVQAYVDCGHVVHPPTARAQIEGAVVFALSAALFGEVTIEAGQVREGNFDSVRLLRMGECPPIDVHFVPGGGDTWGGLGEPGVPPLAPALCNAVHRATGTRVRSLPLARQDLRWSASRRTSG